MKKIAAIVLLGLLALPARSQQETVTTEIVAVALDELVSGLYFHNGKDISTFQANPTGLGEPLAYKGPRRFELRNSEAEFTQKPPLPPPAAAVDLPLDSNRVLVVCAKTGKEPLKLVAFDIGSAKIRAGDYRFFNFSRSVVSAILGGKKFALKPGTNTLVSNSSWKDEVMEIDMDLAVVRGDKPKPVYSSQWGHRPGRRNYVFLFDGPQEYKPIRICRFFDVPPSEPVKAEP